MPDKEKETSKKVPSPAFLRLLNSIQPPKDGYYLDAEQTGVDDRGIPQYSVTKISEVPANRDTLIPIVTALAPRRGLVAAKIDPLKTLDTGRMHFIPDYSDNFIDHSLSKTPDPGILRVTNAVEELSAVDAIRQLEKTEKKGLPKVVKEKTRKDTRDRIEALVGPRHEIRDTYRVGDVMATEVIPQRRVDPLFCVRMGPDKSDRSMNRLFEAAFVQAMYGRIANHEDALRRAVKLGKTAGTAAYSQCLAGAKWNLGELVFVGRIVYSDGDFITNGFANLR